jgi:hypothetical protein
MKQPRTITDNESTLHTGAVPSAHQPALPTKTRVYTLCQTAERVPDPCALAGIPVA